MAAMLHPSRAELDNLSTFSHIGAHIGMNADALSGLMAVLDVTDEDSPVHIAMLELKAFEMEIQDWTWKVTIENEEVVKKPRALHRGQAGLFHRYCCLLAGTVISANDKGALGPVLPATSQPGSTAPSQPPPPVVEAEAVGAVVPEAGVTAEDDKTQIIIETSPKGFKRSPTPTRPLQRKVLKRMVKFSHTINQDVEHEVERMPLGESDAAYKTWNRMTGSDPPPLKEPTQDQLTTLQATVDEGAPPYTDFAVWGNSTYRKARKPKLRGLRPSGDGAWIPILLAAPESIQVWSECYAVYRTAVMMLKILMSAIVDEYYDRVWYYYGLYGPS